MPYSGFQVTADPRQRVLFGAEQFRDGAVPTGAQPRSEHGDEGAARSEGGGEAAAGQAPAPGLVIYAKTGRASVSPVQAVAPDSVESALSLGFRFPSAADIADAGVAAEWLLRADVAGSRSGDRLARTGSGVVGYDRRAGARAMFPGAKSSWRVHDAPEMEGLTLALRIAPGAVTLSARSPVRDARRVERGASRHRRDSLSADAVASWVKGQAPDDADVSAWWGSLDQCEQQALIDQAASAVGAVALAGDPDSTCEVKGSDAAGPSARWLSLDESEQHALTDKVRSAAALADVPDLTREVTEWSRKSRAQMVKAFAELDYSPMVGQLPVMVTLTYPRCWLSVAPTGAVVKAHLKAFRKRWERRFGGPLAALWKLEFQGRAPEKRCSCDGCGDRDDGRAPHIHLWLARPQVSRKGGPVTHSGFTQWLSQAWADVVAHPNPTQRMLHEKAGTAVDVVAGLRGSDPKRLAIYFSKHGAAQGDSSGKEYQHRVPEVWQGPGQGPGRFWGYWKFTRTATSVTMSPEDFIAAKRILRRWSRSRASYRSGERFPASVHPVTARRRVRRVDASGRERWRWSRSRRPLFTQSGLVGGFACTNSGVALAISVVQALRLESPPPYWARSDFSRVW